MGDNGTGNQPHLTEFSKGFRFWDNQLGDEKGQGKKEEVVYGCRTIVAQLMKNNLMQDKFDWQNPIVPVQEST